MSNNQEWIKRQDSSTTARREYEYERLTVLALDQIYEAMERNGLTKADLARALGTSRANITQLFAGGRNLTLHTLSDLAWACGVRICVSIEPLRTGEFISSPVMVVEPRRTVVRDLQSGFAGDSQTTACDDAEFAVGACSVVGGCSA